MERIASFCINHDTLTPGMYLSRVDGDVTTFDLRTRRPNAGEYMDNPTMHTFEHLFATYIRNSAIGSSVLYFGPMGCQTGFYLLVRGVENERVLAVLKDALKKTVAHEGEVFGASAVECGNYQSLSLDKAKAEAQRYLAVLEQKEKWSFLYE